MTNVLFLTSASVLAEEDIDQGGGYFNG